MTYSTRTMQADDWAVLAYFTANEFTHPDKMGYEFMLWLDRVRARARVPMTVTSSSRTPEHNAEVHGAKDSAHVDVPCNSVDIGMRPTPDDPHWNLARGKIIFAAYELGGRRFGFYPNGSLHLDRTELIRPAAFWFAVDNPA